MHKGIWMSTWIALLFAAQLSVAASPSAEVSWESLKSRGDSAFNEEQWDAAELQYRKALRRSERDGASAADRADLYNQLGRALYQTDQLAAAQKFYQRGLDLLASSDSAESDTAAATWFNLGHVQAEMGQIQEAEYAYTRCAEIERKTLGKQSADLAVTLAQLGSLLVNNKQYKRADPILAETVAIRREIDDPETAESVKDWAINRYWLSDYEKATELAHEAIERSATLPKIKGLSFNVLAMSYEAKQEYAKAGAHYRYALRILRDALGFEHSQFKTVAGNYADMAIDYDPAWGPEAPE